MVIEKQKILITGIAGFIGSFLGKKLLEEGKYVVGIDNINDYYDQSLKKDRLKFIQKADLKKESFIFFEKDLQDINAMQEIFKKYNPDVVVNLAAQAGVRYSLVNPKSYIQSNLVGFSNILECCREFKVKHLIYASSSSVYGGNQELPFNEAQIVDTPLSLYAATKKSNELMAYSYSHLYKLPCTGLRFFTVYGPWGRPDMAPMIFAKLINENKPIDVFNFGEMSRDFTYIDDVIIILNNCCKKIPLSRGGKDNKINFESPPHQIFNVGNNKPIPLNYFISLIEKNLGKNARKNFKSLQPGDLVSTYADIDKISNWVNFIPKTNIEEGIEKFIDWYKKYYD